LPDWIDRFAGLARLEEDLRRQLLARSRVASQRRGWIEARRGRVVRSDRDALRRLAHDRIGSA